MYSKQKRCIVADFMPYSDVAECSLLQWIDYFLHSDKTALYQTQKYIYIKLIYQVNCIEFKFLLFHVDIILLPRSYPRLISPRLMFFYQETVFNDSFKYSHLKKFQSVPCVVSECYRSVKEHPSGIVLTISAQGVYTSRTGH